MDFVIGRQFPFHSNEHVNSTFDDVLEIHQDMPSPLC